MIEQNKSQPDPKPMFNWIITDRCNYACPYCSFPNLLVSYGHCSDTLISRVFEMVDTLEGQWLIGLIGGEALIHPKIREICSGIRQRGHTITMTTNLGVSRERIQGFIDACGEGLENIMVSLHESQIRDLDSYIGNILYFRDHKYPKTFFHVTSVMTEENFERLREIDQRLEQEGIRLCFQGLTCDGRYVPYPPRIEEYLSGRMTRNAETIRRANFRGRICYSGKYYFVVSNEGHVYRCNNMQPHYYMGDVLKGTFKPLARPIPCLSPRCTCTTAANRNMIRYDEKIGSAKTFLYWYPCGVIQNIPMRIHHTKKFFLKMARRIKRRFSK
jgi:MoaA/NifB/PqqE/SkfB family radical SAM enzyme